MEVAFSQTALEQYCSDGMDLVQTNNLAKQSHLVALLRDTYASGACLSGVRSGQKEVSDVVAVEEADERTWNLVGVMTAAEADCSGLRGNYCESQTNCGQCTRRYGENC